MDFTELVSIVLPTFNRGYLIGETIQSVIDQSYTHWELIVIDDGSTDETRERVQAFNESRILYHFIEHTGQLGKVRNEGLHRATGNFVAFLDSDDLWLPHKIESQLSLLTAYPEASFVFSNGDQFGDGATPTPLLENFFVGKTFLPFLFGGRFIFYVPSLLFRKEVMNRIPLLDESLKSASDILFFLRMAYDYCGIYTNESLIQIRKHSANHSNEMEMVAFLEYLSVLKKLFEENKLTNTQYSSLTARSYYRQGLHHLNQGKTKEARNEFIQSLKSRPAHLKSWVRILQSFFS
jgi:glycosyltransferase involved in cell wall biosynthesis